MIDARIQVKELLENIGVPVKMRYPKTPPTSKQITFFELTNTQTKVKVRESLSFQIDAWATTLEDVIDLSIEVAFFMEQLGFRRDYVSPDSDIEDASGIYRKTLRFSCHVDTRTNRIID